MDKLNIYDNSAIILDKKTPKSIISWLTILIIFIILFMIFSFVPFNIYTSLTGYIKIKNKISYISLDLSEGDFPINNSSILYIKDTKYNYKIISIEENNIMLEVDLEDDIKIENNYIKINILKEKITLFEIIKNKIKKGLES